MTDKQHQLYIDYASYSSMNEEQKNIFWHKRKEEAKKMPQEEKTAWDEAIINNLKAIKERLKDISSRIDSSEKVLV